MQAHTEHIEYTFWLLPIIINNNNCICNEIKMYFTVKF